MLALHTSSAPCVSALSQPKLEHEDTEHSTADVGTGEGDVGSGVGQLAEFSSRTSAQHAAYTLEVAE